MPPIKTMLDPKLRETLRHVARFYDQRKVGDIGSLGFRRSTDLAKLAACLEPLIHRGHLIPGRSRFLDMGCADGRVNLLLSYLVERSIGVELDEWTLAEYSPLRMELEASLRSKALILPPTNTLLYHGNSTEDEIYRRIGKEAGVGPADFDLFYTYLSMYEEFAGVIAEKAKKGSVFMLYGVERILPQLEGLHLLTPRRPIQGILALYQKM
jgi:hypothetical protein